jgi:hypothetical protein
MAQRTRRAGNPLELAVVSFHWKRFLSVVEGRSPRQLGERRQQEGKTVGLQESVVAGLGGIEGCGVPRSPAHCLPWLGAESGCFEVMRHR